MNDQKKIEDILHSIQELILEAQNEEKLDRLETSEVINLDKFDQATIGNLEKKENYKKRYLDKIQKEIPTEVKNFEINPTENNNSLKNSWKNFNFQKCQEKPQRQILEEIKKESDQIEKIFKDSLNFWIKKNLPDLIKEETALHTKKILEEKLK
ncbi:MAG: hypothetical protein CMM92_01825 [Rickettsiales bacterium]|nr:hypothetical protein [Rickettsiales bacterium]RPG15334.1 MAG: hypothetical protein CBD55_001820 [Pelagibacteraceae bacterium TMED195]|tara:strand:- start:5978 stop:6439 length:462 start_codon:yes stop_codon:yes gene_type:complete